MDGEKVKEGDAANRTSARRWQRCTKEAGSLRRVVQARKKKSFFSGSTSGSSPNLSSTAGAFPRKLFLARTAWPKIYLPAILGRFVTLVTAKPEGSLSLHLQLCLKLWRMRYKHRCGSLDFMRCAELYEHQNSKVCPYRWVFDQ